MTTSSCKSSQLCSGDNGVIVVAIDDAMAGLLRTGRVRMTLLLLVVAIMVAGWGVACVDAFVRPIAAAGTAAGTFATTSTTAIAAAAASAAPRRFPDNVDGPLYVNDRCINCAACSMFSPHSFERSSSAVGGNNDHHHRVYRQPQTDDEIEQARAALAACPVAAIRVETPAQRNHNGIPPPMTDGDEDANLTKRLGLNPKFNGGADPPFPRRVVGGDISDKARDSFSPEVYFLGHHNEKSFGATPYLFHSAAHSNCWIMVDTPKFSKSAVKAVETLTGIGRGPAYLILTHVDDTAGHNEWKDHYGSSLRRVFHAGDLGRHNWIGDTTLEGVEVLLRPPETDGRPSSLQAYDLTGTPIDDEAAAKEEVVLLHTPGHSPGSISVLFRSQGGDGDGHNDDGHGHGVLFTGDTYAYRLSANAMTGMPQYGYDRRQQAETLRLLLPGGGVSAKSNAANNPRSWLDWSVVMPGHGHYRDYSYIGDPDERHHVQRQEMEPALEELEAYYPAAQQQDATGAADTKTTTTTLAQQLWIAYIQSENAAASTT